MSFAACTFIGTGVRVEGGGAGACLQPIERAPSDANRARADSARRPKDISDGILCNESAAPDCLDAPRRPLKTSVSLRR